METDTNFSEANGGGASRNSAPTSKALSDAAAAADFQTLQKKLRNLPDSRPETVAEARKLIVDPNYPSHYTQQALAQVLAVHLASGTDSLPT